jgi:gliding motility-associated-like protein
MIITFDTHFSFYPDISMLPFVYIYIAIYFQTLMYSGFRLITLFLSLLFSADISAQPPVCQNPPAMTSFCSQACIICDIDGFKGRNNSSITGQAPPGFCTTFVHHMQWIGFIAGSQDLSIEVTVSNCTRNNGLEIGLYESLNCQTFRRISECDTDVRPGQTRLFENIVPLTVGQYYYFVMDGSGDDICDYSIRVISGSTKVNPLIDAPEMDFPVQACKNELIELATSGIPGATFYDWLINGNYQATDRTIRHQFDSAGIYDICLHAYNVCNRAPVICRKIEILDTPLSRTEQEVCFGECYNFYSGLYCESGIYKEILTSMNGCDSIIELSLTVSNQIFATASLRICNGDTLTIGDQSFTEAGEHQAIIRSQEGCSIYLSFNLLIIECNIQSSATVQHVQCNGTDSGSIEFTVDSGTGPFEYSGIKIENPSVHFQGMIESVDETVHIPDLGEGNYYITIMDGFDNIHYLYVFVDQPPPLRMEILTTDYSGFEVSCFGAGDGEITVLPTGGTAPYTTYFADTGTTGNSSTELKAGSYEILLTDANGCAYSTSVTMRSPDRLEPSYIATGPDCAGPETGRITVVNTVGGAPRYQYSLNDAYQDASGDFRDLEEGTYVLKVQDANGCTASVSVNLKAAVIPEITAQQQEYVVKLGESFDMSIETIPSDVTVVWSPADFLSCTDCKSTTAFPTENINYSVVVTSRDNCTDVQYFTIEVEKVRTFIISDAFTPNGDGTNDRLVYFAGKDVASIEDFKIFDRWGNRVCYFSHLAAGNHQIAWDGTYKGKSGEEGIYTYSVKVHFIDQITIHYTGTLLLVR